MCWGPPLERKLAQMLFCTTCWCVRTPNHAHAGHLLAAEVPTHALCAGGRLGSARRACACAAARRRHQLQPGVRPAAQQPGRLAGQPPVGADARRGDARAWQLPPWRPALPCLAAAGPLQAHRGAAMRRRSTLRGRRRAAPARLGVRAQRRGHAGPGPGGRPRAPLPAARPAPRPGRQRRRRGRADTA